MKVKSKIKAGECHSCSDGEPNHGARLRRPVDMKVKTKVKAGECHSCGDGDPNHGVRLRRRQR